jgi:hypothetical protein
MEEPDAGYISYAWGLRPDERELLEKIRQRLIANSMTNTDFDFLSDLMLYHDAKKITIARLLGLSSGTELDRL